MKKPLFFSELEKITGSPNGIRTRVSALRGLRPKPLDDGAKHKLSFETTIKKSRFKKRLRNPPLIRDSFLSEIYCIISSSQKRFFGSCFGRIYMKVHVHKTELLEGKNIFSKKNYEAVLFDLDGVITTTEKNHSACWKKTFDEFLRLRAEETGEPFIPFDETEDYLRCVDGKPRYEGVRSFLRSRAIELPEGNRNSSTGERSVFGLGNRKNQMFTETLEKQPPEIYRTSVELALNLKEAGFRLAIVSSSRNCRRVMAAAGIEHLFELAVDGIVACEKGLRGKPEPDTFIEAARALGSKPGRTVVIEDAAAGVAAGARGGFGLVIGVARKQNEEELLLNGADVVVRDLGEFQSHYK